MPCYDDRNSPDYVARETREDCRHNSDVAEMLCTVISTMRRSAKAGEFGVHINDILNLPGLRKWADEHDEYDKQKRKAAKQYKNPHG